MPGARPVKPRDGDYGRRRPRAVARRRLAGGPAPDRDRRARGQLLRARRGPGDPLRPRPRRLLAVVARAACRSSRASHRVVAMDLPGFGYSESPSEDISIEYYARWTAEFMDVAGDRVGGGGGQLDGRLRQRRAGDQVPRSACSGSCSSRRRSSGRTGAAPSRWCSSRGCPTRSWPARSCAPPTTSRRGGGSATPRSRSAGFRYPQYVSDELAHEMVRSARRTDGFLPALEALAGYDLEEELPEDQLPDADRVGRERPAGLGQGRRAAART